VRHLFFHKMGVVDAYNVVQGELLQSCQTGGHVEDILVGRGRLDIAQAFVPENRVAVAVDAGLQLQP
jgi:hypothetical protein